MPIAIGLSFCTPSLPDIFWHAEALGQHPEVASVNIVHWPIHPEAPFQFESTEHYTLHPKEKHCRESLKQLLAQINPTAIVCSGWMDSDYNAIAKAYHKRIPVVLTLDNWWTGSLKQRPRGTHCPMVHPSTVQPSLGARRTINSLRPKTRILRQLPRNRILLRRPRAFQVIYEKRKTTPPAKKILYIGRYLDVKGVRELWAAFMEMSDEFPEWELHCIGTGELWDSRAIHPKIIHYGFQTAL